MTTPLRIAVPGDEGLEVALGDAHCSAEVVRDEITALNPPANCPGRDSYNLRHVRTGEEFHRLAGFRLAWGHWSSLD